MSAAAEQYIETFTHPQVKGSARRLLEVIGKQIPEGQTMTPEITIPELATLMGYRDNAARRGRQVLMKLGVVRILGSAQGQVSRYELMLLPDARGDDPALPLIGAAAPPRARRPRVHDEPDLFDVPAGDAMRAEGERNTDNFDQNDRSWRRYFDHFDRSSRWCSAVLRSFWAMLVRNFDHFDRSVTVDGQVRANNIDHFDRSTHPLDGTYVHTFKNVHTHTARAPADAPHDTGPPPPVIVHPWHAWCGPMCVPKDLHQEWLRKGHAAEWLFAFYARRCATIAPGKIAVNDFTWWRAALKAELALRGSAPSPHTPRDVYAEADAQARRRHGRH